MDVNSFIENGYQWLLGILTALIWIFKVDARSRENEKDIAEAKEKVSGLDHRVSDINNSVIRMETIFEGMEKTVIRIDDKLERILEGKR